MDDEEKARQYCYVNGIEEKEKYITWLGTANYIAGKKWLKYELYKQGTYWRVETKIPFWVYVEQFITEHPEIEIVQAIGEMNG